MPSNSSGAMSADGLPGGRSKVEIPPSRLGSRHVTGRFFACDVSIEISEDAVFVRLKKFANVLAIHVLFSLIV